MPSRDTSTRAHPEHDRLLVARYAAGDAYPSEIGPAQGLVDNCAECASLAADIGLISARTAELPAIKRPRDFRITAEQADRLRGSWLERVMRRIAMPGWTVVRPLAGAAMAIALVLVVVGALPLNGFGTGAAAPAALPALSTADSATQPNTQNVGGNVGPVATSADTQVFAPTQPAPVIGPTTPEFAAQPSDAAGGMSTSSETPAEVTGNPDSVPPTAHAEPPAKSQESPQMPESATQAPVDTPREVIAGVPTAHPSPAPNAQIASNGGAKVPPSSGSAADRTWLVAGGLLLGFLALMSLLAVWLVRRRYSDPLVR